MNWDLNGLMERLEGDRDFLLELLVMFQQDVWSNLEKSRLALAGGELEELSRVAHTMKGMLRNLSMSAAGQSAAALETAAREGHAEECRQLLVQLSLQLESILPEVEAQLAEVKS